MRKKLKRTLLLLLAALTALLVFVGCELGVTKDEALNGYNLTSSVTYYANGGNFSSGKTAQEIWYRENSKPIDLVNDTHTSGTTIKLNRENHKFLQWYHVLQTGVNEDGTPILAYTYDELTEQNIYTPDKTKPVDFNAILQKDEHWHICAEWEAKLMVQVYLLSDTPIVSPEKTYYSITSDEGQADNQTALLGTYKFINGVADLAWDFTPMDVDSDHTFVGYYYDLACTQLVTDEIVAGNESVTLYAKYIDGDWDVIREADDVEDMVRATSGNFYFIMDVDMAGTACRAQATRNTRFKVLGNGFTVKNLTVEYPNGSKDVSLFGTLTKDAVMEDLTFENVTCNWTFRQANADQYYNAYFVCSGVEEGASISNVNFTGDLALNISIPAEKVTLMNFATQDGGYKYTNCLFGGESDEAYTTANPNGFKVDGNPETFVTITKGA